MPVPPLSGFDKAVKKGAVKFTTAVVLNAFMATGANLYYALSSYSVLA